jgi:hypothetical protein
LSLLQFLYAFLRLELICQKLNFYFNNQIREGDDDLHVNLVCISMENSLNLVCAIHFLPFYFGVAGSDVPFILRFRFGRC